MFNISRYHIIHQYVCIHSQIVIPKNIYNNEPKIVNKEIQDGMLCLTHIYPHTETHTHFPSTSS